MKIIEIGSIIEFRIYVVIRMIELSGSVGVADINDV